VRGVAGGVGGRSVVSVADASKITWLREGLSRRERLCPARSNAPSTRIYVAAPRIRDRPLGLSYKVPCARIKMRFMATRIASPLGRTAAHRTAE